MIQIHNKTLYCTVIKRFAIRGTEHSVEDAPLQIHQQDITWYGPMRTSIFHCHPLLGYNYIPAGIGIYTLNLDTESTISPSINAFTLFRLLNITR